MSRAITLASILIALIVAACGGVQATPSPTSAPPTSAPSPAPTGTPAPAGTPLPSPTEGAGQNPEIVLDVANDWHVVATVVDATGRLVSATSGAAQATMTVRWFDSQVVNVDPSTASVTWVGLPRDEDITVDVTEAGGKLVLTITQASPPLQSDAEGLDRVLVLKLGSPIDATDVSVSFVAAA